MLDDRTEAYFKAAQEERGYIGCNNGWEGIQDILNIKAPGVTVEKVTTYDGYMNSSIIEVFQYEANGKQRYCAELSYQTDIDDYNVETHIFSKLPSRSDIMVIRDIQNLEFSFKYDGLKPVFACWECGITSHWLDIHGTLQEKITGVKEKYCGC